MNVFKIELKKLNKFEKALKQFNEYNIPSYLDIVNLWTSYKKLFNFGDDLSGKVYFKLYKKHGSLNSNLYKERLKLYTYYSKEISFWLLKKYLTEEQYNILLDKFQNLSTKLKASYIDKCGEKQYKALYLDNEIYLLNI